MNGAGTALSAFAGAAIAFQSLKLRSSAVRSALLDVTRDGRANAYEDIALSAAVGLGGYLALRAVDRRAGRKTKRPAAFLAGAMFLPVLASVVPAA